MARDAGKLQRRRSYELALSEIRPLARSVVNAISNCLASVEKLVLIAWRSLFAWPSLLIASQAIEGPETVFMSQQNMLPGGLVRSCLWPTLVLF